MEKIFYKEEQKFNQAWVWLILVIFLIPFFIVGNQLLELIKADSDDYLTLSLVLFVLLVSSIPVIWLFVKMKLVVEIRKDGIWYKFPPLLNKWKTINKSEIENFEIRKYKPIKEYGGWGIKGKFKSKAYNVSGNIGLQLYLKNGRKVLFGTQRQEAIENAMKKLMNDGVDI